MQSYRGRVILLIDTFSLVFRAHHALPAMTTSRGEPTSALYGLSVLLLKLLRERQPERVALAADRGPSFRRDIDRNYKAHRGATPPELSTQLQALPSLADALGVPLLFAPGFEADDVLATLARYHAREGHDVLLVSGDRDLFQVVGPKVQVLFVGRRGQDHVLYDEAAVHARYELLPSQLPSFIAVTGDPSDNLPKVPGAGPKTASQWLKQFGDVDGILAHLDALKPARLRRVVAAHAEQMRRSEDLARLRTDIDLGPGPTSAAITQAQLQELKAWFRKWEFLSLVDRVDRVPLPSSSKPAR